VFPGCTFVAVFIIVVTVVQSDSTGDAVGAILGYFDRRPPRRIDLFAILSLVDLIAQRAGGAVADRTDDLVHPATASSDEPFLALPEDDRQPVGAKAGVRTGTTVVQHRDLEAVVPVTPVRNPARVLVSVELDAGVAAVAQGLEV
jgi:hypothetical protein